MLFLGFKVPDSSYQKSRYLLYFIARSRFERKYSEILRLARNVLNRLIPEGLAFTLCLLINLHEWRSRIGSMKRIPARVG